MEWLCMASDMLLHVSSSTRMQAAKCKASVISAEVVCPVKPSPPPRSPVKPPPPPKVYPCEVCYQWSIQTWKGDYCNLFNAEQIVDVIQVVANGKHDAMLYEVWCSVSKRLDMNVLLSRV